MSKSSRTNLKQHILDFGLYQGHTELCAYIYHIYNPVSFPGTSYFSLQGGKEVFIAPPSFCFPFSFYLAGGPTPTLSSPFSSVSYLHLMETGG